MDMLEFSKLCFVPVPCFFDDGKKYFVNYTGFKGRCSEWITGIQSPGLSHKNP